MDPTTSTQQAHNKGCDEALRCLEMEESASTISFHPLITLIEWEHTERQHLPWVRLSFRNGPASSEAVILLLITAPALFCGSTHLPPGITSRKKQNIPFIAKLLVAYYPSRPF